MPNDRMHACMFLSVLAARAQTLLRSVIGVPRLQETACGVAGPSYRL